MTRKLIILATGLVLLSGLSACGKQNHSSEQSEVNTSRLHKHKVTAKDVNNKVQQIQANNYKQILSAKYHASSKNVSIKLNPKLQSRVQQCIKDNNRANKYLNKKRNQFNKRKNTAKRHKKHIAISSNVNVYISSKDLQVINQLKILDKKIQGQIQNINTNLQNKNTQTGEEYNINSYYITHISKHYQNNLFYRINQKKNVRKHGRGVIVKINLLFYMPKR